MYGLGQGILHEQAAKEQAYAECVALNQGNCVKPTPLPPLAQTLPELTTTAPMPLWPLLAIGALLLMKGGTR